MGTTVLSEDDPILHLDIVPIPIYRPFIWLRDGWLDMRKHWGASLGYGGLIVALGWTLLVFCGTHPYFIVAALLPRPAGEF
jgi:hypothetical protein